FCTYVLLYGVTRSIIEFFRGDHRGIFLGGMISTSQLIGVIMAAIAIAMLIILRPRNVRS
ncbi:MAG: prolipoprotein diacylglyceryl transferase, partial [Desulfobacterales bacterium]|nr:prolipoprotein diacylglyceryl transferase [Desulfobacterales bacterium]